MKTGRKQKRKTYNFNLRSEGNQGNRKKQKVGSQPLGLTTPGASIHNSQGIRDQRGRTRRTKKKNPSQNLPQDAAHCGTTGQQSQSVTPNRLVASPSEQQSQSVTPNRLVASPPHVARTLHDYFEEVPVRSRTNVRRRTVPDLTAYNIVEVCQKLGFECNTNINRVRCVLKNINPALYQKLNRIEPQNKLQRQIRQFEIDMAHISFKLCDLCSRHYLRPGAIELSESASRWSYY